jgi:hypothetical protein
MNFNDILYLISLVGCIVLLLFRGRIRDNSLKTKLLSVISILIISIIPYINTIVLIMLILDWFTDMYDYRDLNKKKKRPF